MNKILLALGLIATIALVGCNKDKAPELIRSAHV
jgi:hypothetical protein